MIVDAAGFTLIHAVGRSQPGEPLGFVGLKISADASLRDCIPAADLADDLTAFGWIQSRSQERTEHFCPFSGDLVGFAMVFHGQFLTFKVLRMILQS